MPKLLATTTPNTAVNSINCLHKHPHNGTHADTYAQIMTAMYCTEALTQSILTCYDHLT